MGEISANVKMESWTDDRGLWIRHTLTIEGRESVTLYGPIDPQSIATMTTRKGPVMLLGAPIPVRDIVPADKETR